MSFLRIAFRTAAGTGLALSLLAGACSGTETGNPPNSLQLALMVTSSDPAVATVGGGAAPLAINEAWVSLQALELVPCAGGTGVIAHDLPADLSADPPQQVHFESTVAEYCGLRVHVGPSNVAPVGFEGKSVALRGSRSDGVPIELTSTLVGVFNLVTVPAATPFDARFVVLGFDLAPWFHGIDLQLPTPDANGVVVIDTASNPDLLATFEAQLGLGVSLYLDGDHDGRLGPAEATPIAGAH